MKYVRTKDGIYELDKYKEKYHYFKVNGSAYKLQKISECKQANTIEELCDEFVVMSGYSFRHDTFKTLRNAIKHSKLFPFEVMYIYGAIWTDIGLIYVAKMNDKGELELLWKLNKQKRWIWFATMQKNI